jgi:UDP-glucose 4-epimerase
MTPRPISPYGASKLAGEVYGQIFQRSYGLEFVALRYFTVFGPRQDPGSPYSGVLSVFNAALINGYQPTIHGDGEQSRDFTYVRNVAEANLLACTTTDAAGLVFNVGTGNRYTLNHTLQLLGKISGMPVKAKYGPAREADIRDSQADIAQARMILGYNPAIGFEEGLKLSWEWYCSYQRARAMAAAGTL